jgi:hypothetical protein
MEMIAGSSRDDPWIRFPGEATKIRMSTSNDVIVPATQRLQQTDAMATVVPPSHRCIAWCLSLCGQDFASGNSAMQQTDQTDMGNRDASGGTARNSASGESWLDW